MKKVLIVISAVVVTALVAIVGWLVVNPSTVPKHVSEPSLSSTAPATQNPVPTDGKTYFPTEPAATKEPVKSVEDITKFDDAKAVSSFSKEDVQYALKASYQYASNALSNKYFLGGQWAKDGYPVETMVGTNESLMSTSLRDKLLKIETDPTKNPNALKDVLPIVLYMNEGDGQSPAKSCMDENAVACPLDGLDFSEMKYSVDSISEGEALDVDFTVKTRIPVLKNGKDSYIDADYHYILRFTLNDNYSEQAGSPVLVVSDYDVKLNVTPEKNN